MKKTIALIAVLLLFVFAAVFSGSARADTITNYVLSSGNSALSGYPGPYANVLVNLTSDTTAIITFTGLSNPTYQYLIGGAQAADLNVNASTFAANGFSWTGGQTLSNPITAFSPEASPTNNVDGFGKLNLQIDDNDGLKDAVSQLVFTLTNQSGTWSDSSSVLTPNSLGYYAAAHIYVVDKLDGCNPATGFAGVKVPEPSTFLLMGSGLLGLALFGMSARRKREN